ncbi:MAG: hypothetical protein QM758_24035 [Armatimonas sp.]
MVLASGAVSAHADLLAVELRAERAFVRADGRSRVLLLATVRDEKGSTVADGLGVRFTISAGGGRLESASAVTRGGVARVVLIAPDQPGVTTITATLDPPAVAVPSLGSVTFTNDADLVSAGSNWIRMRGKRFLGYAVGIAGQTSNRLVYADGEDGGATLSYRGMNFQADQIQFDTNTNVVIAAGNVVLKLGEQKRKYDLLRVELGQNKAYALRNGSSPIVVELPTLKETLLEGEVSPKLFEFTPFNQTRKNADGEEEEVPPALTLIADSIAIEPGRQIQFRKVSLYVQGQKTGKLPLHVMALNQQSLFREQVIGAGPQGLAFDIPYYYAVQPSDIGSLHLRRGAQFGSSIYSQRLGWNLDLEHNYTGRNGGLGSFQILGMNRTDRGMRWQHNQKLGERTDASLYMDSPNPKSVFGSGQLSRNFSGWRLNAMATGGQQRFSTLTDAGIVGASQGDIRTQLLAETDPKSLGKKSPFQYSLTTEWMKQHFFGTSAAEPVTTQTVGARLFSRPIPLGHSWNLTQSFSTGQVWTRGSTIARDGLSLLSTSSFMRPIRRKGQILGGTSFSYDYTQQPQITGLAPGVVVANGRHRVSMGTSVDMNGAWSLSFNAMQGLDSKQSSLYGEVGVKLSGPWSTRVRVSDTLSGTVRIRDTELALSRLFGQSEVSVYYSTLARRFQLDLSGARF